MSSLALAPAEGGLRRYLSDIRKFPMLGKDEEYMLARRWREHHDTAAAHKLVTSHLRLSAKIAFKYRGYGLPITDMISEGNLGLMHAVKKFDPDKGFRLATYAVWWIRAAIQDYILRSWSLVKMGTTSAQKKLFFNLSRAKARIAALGTSGLRPDQAEAIARDLSVCTHDVIAMDHRLAGRDSSLNAPCSDGFDLEWQDLLADENAQSPEMQLAESEARDLGARLLREAMDTLNARERRILTERRLSEDPPMLEELAREYGVSRERVRQIEARAFEKVQAFVAQRADLSGRCCVEGRA